MVLTLRWRDWKFQGIMEIVDESSDDDMEIVDERGEIIMRKQLIVVKILRMS